MPSLRSTAITENSLTQHLQRIQSGMDRCYHKSCSKIVLYPINCLILEYTFPLPTHVHSYHNPRELLSNSTSIHRSIVNHIRNSVRHTQYRTMAQLTSIRSNNGFTNSSNHTLLYLKGPTCTLLTEQVCCRNVQGIPLYECITTMTSLPSVTNCVKYRCLGSSASSDTVVDVGPPTDNNVMDWRG
jgi:hypothetical protein